MKFKNSIFEERYNEYWNNNVVTVDQIIRNVSLGFKLFDDTNIGKLIEKYQHHVMNILSNLERQSYLFEDKEYLQEYKQSSIAQVVEDFSFYEKIFPEYDGITSKFLTTLGIKPLEKNKEVESNFSVTMQ